jgi:hypothetical protein
LFSDFIGVSVKGDPRHSPPQGGQADGTPCVYPGASIAMANVTDYDDQRMVLATADALTLG